MATPSEVKVALDDIARVISTKRATLVNYKTGATDVAMALNALPSDYADVIATIGNYGTQDAFEANAKAEFTKLAAEFGALVTSANSIANTSV